ncbi:MAG: hypothetical protein K8F91_21500 [Candidatus Obscuribacterales bacterium]|nr:hypothetical protein [Candidatus Obscuribacterales bacterium]
MAREKKQRKRKAESRKRKLAAQRQKSLLKDKQSQCNADAVIEHDFAFAPATRDLGDQLTVDFFTCAFDDWTAPDGSHYLGDTQIEQQPVETLLNLFDADSATSDENSIGPEGNGSRTLSENQYMVPSGQNLNRASMFADKEDGSKTKNGDNGHEEVDIIIPISEDILSCFHQQRWLEEQELERKLERKLEKKLEIELEMEQEKAQPEAIEPVPVPVSEEQPCSPQESKTGQKMMVPVSELHERIKTFLSSVKEGWVPPGNQYERCALVPALPAQTLDLENQLCDKHYSDLTGTEVEYDWATRRKQVNQLRTLEELAVAGHFTYRAKQWHTEHPDFVEPDSKPPEVTVELDCSINNEASIEPGTTLKAGALPSRELSRPVRINAVSDHVDKLREVRDRHDRYEARLTAEYLIDQVDIGQRSGLTLNPCSLREGVKHWYPKRAKDAGYGASADRAEWTRTYCRDISTSANYG